MKKLTYKFNLSIGYANAGHSDTQTLEFEDDDPQEYIDSCVEETYLDWRNNFLDGGWELINEEVTPEE